MHTHMHRNSHPNAWYKHTSTFIDQWMSSVFYSFSYTSPLSSSSCHFMGHILTNHTCRPIGFQTDKLWILIIISKLFELIWLVGDDSTPFKPHTTLIIMTTRLSINKVQLWSNGGWFPLILSLFIPSLLTTTTKPFGIMTSRDRTIVRWSGGK